MAWVIVSIGPPPLFVRTKAPSGVTFQRLEADRFDTEMEATKKLLELRLPRDWFVISDERPDGSNRPTLL